MKKLFLTIGIVALVIVIVSAILAVLSVFELVQFFPKFAFNEQENYASEQAIIMVAYVDTLEAREFQIEEVWLVYLVTSRLDTAIIQEAQQAPVSPNLLKKPFTRTRLVRHMESDENVEIDYVFLIDGIGRQLVNNLLENQQSSINLDENGSFCEILSSSELQMFDLYMKYAEGHVYTTIPDSLITQSAIIENKTDSFYCESIEP